jgi:ribonuclease HI
MTLYLHTDGGARGNPGPAATGMVLFDKERNVIAAAGKKIGTATNNVAEYTALLKGLELAAKHTADELKCFLDSELAVRQLRGEYKVKSEELKKLFAAVKEQEKRFAKVMYSHVPRENRYQQLADREVNKALDG